MKASVSMQESKLQVLVLYDMQAPVPSTIKDHLTALVEDSDHHVLGLEMLGELPSELDLNRFDVIVIHYTLCIYLDTYLDDDAKRRIREAAPLKAIFIQDEYRFVNATIEAMRYLRVKLLFTCAPAGVAEKIYPQNELPEVRKVSVLTGYTSPRLLTSGKPPPLVDRSIDVGYRARKLPAWLGALGREKWRISERFQVDAKRFDLRCDLSAREEDRLYGEDWEQFLRSCRAVLGTESGASVIDFTGEIKQRVEEEERRRPDVTFEELRQKYFGKLDGQLGISVISPRCFEAAAHGTLLILYEGGYSGRLQPWRHYLPLKKDHSNVEEIVEVLLDDARAQEIADQAWVEVAQAPENSYAAFSDLVDEALASEVALGPRRSFTPYDAVSFKRDHSASSSVSS